MLCVHLSLTIFSSQSSLDRFYFYIMQIPQISISLYLFEFKSNSKTIYTVPYFYFFFR